MRLTCDKKRKNSYNTSLYNSKTTIDTYININNIKEITDFRKLKTLLKTDFQVNKDYDIEGERNPMIKVL